MSDRSQKLAEEFNSKTTADKRAALEAEGALQIKNQKIILDQKTLERDAPGIWQQLGMDIAEQCHEFNAEPGVETQLEINLGVANQVRVTDKTSNRTLQVIYDPRKYEIRFTGLRGGKEVHVGIKVLEGESRPSLVDDQDRKYDMESTIDSCLRSLLGLAY